MSSTAHRAEIEAVLNQLASAHASQDADAIADSYAPNAMIYDLAPALARRGMKRQHRCLARRLGRPNRDRLARHRHSHRWQPRICLGTEQNARPPRW